MPNMVACFKWVVDEAYIRRGSGGVLDFSAVDYKVSDYDRNAVEEAVRLREASGGRVVALTVGVPEASKGVKVALSRGADEAVFVADAAFRDLEPAQTAFLLAAAIRTRGLAHDLVLCGEGSGDLYAQQVGPRLAELLGIPCIAFVQKLTLEGDVIRAERRVEEGVEVVLAPLPALVTVLPEINSPRIPGVKATLMASNNPVPMVKHSAHPALPPASLEPVGLAAAQMERACERCGTEGTEMARLGETLRKKGVLS
jgi:electron transfer flavoprotein beta subunit